MPDYETTLSPAEESKFRAWKQFYAPHDSGEDYDLRGAFKAGLRPYPETGHWPDTFKKPNHPTFSDQSIYAKDRPDLAGHWEGDQFVPPATAHYAGGGSVGRQFSFQDIPITIETPKGALHTGPHHEGPPRKMAADYGFIKGTLSHDGDEVDCFVGPHKDSRKVFIVDQHRRDSGEFDESKIFLGFNKKRQALAAYHKSYGPVYGARHRIGHIFSGTVDELKNWLAAGGGKEPAAETMPEHQQEDAVTPTPDDHYRLSHDDLAALGGGDTEAGHATLHNLFPHMLQENGVIPHWAVTILGQGSHETGRKVLDQFVAKVRGSHDQS